jgi:hypothetical protein
MNFGKKVLNESTVEATTVSKEELQQLHRDRGH